MSRKPNPENLIKVAAVDQMLADNPGMTMKRACDLQGIRFSNYRSYLANRKAKEEEAKSWSYIRGSGM